MYIDKSELLQALYARGEVNDLRLVGSEVPERIDTEVYAGLLQSLGIALSELDELAARSQETGGFGGFGGPGARVRRLGS